MKKIKILFTFAFALILLSVSFTVYAADFGISGNIIGYFNYSETKITALCNGIEICHTILEPVKSSDAIERKFSLSGLESGIYDLVISGGNNLGYTVKGIDVSSSIDLTETYIPGISEIALTPGDITGDGFIDAGDVSALSYDIGKSAGPAAYASADINSDMFIDAIDVSILSFNLLKKPTEEIYPDMELINNAKLNPKNGDVTFAEDIEYVSVHKAQADGHHFLLGASIIKHDGFLICAYGQGLLTENDSGSRFACKYSYDMGKTWSEEVVIAGPEGRYSRSHGVLFEYENTVWAFAPKAMYGHGGGYPGLVMEAYTLCEDMSWESHGTVLDENFWPLCEPMVLENGNILIAGLNCKSGAAPAVAISDGDDLTSWRMITLPNKNNLSVWGETSVVDYGDRLVAFIRSASSKMAVSQSFDNGETWTSFTLSDFNIADSKVYGGTLSTGSKYIVYNLGSRATMMISVGEKDGSYGFTTSYILKNVFDSKPVYWASNEWSYPYAYEADGNLYVVYAKNKEDCELAIVPLSSIEPKDYDPNYQSVLYEQAYAGKDVAIPEHTVICELVDSDSWWTGDGSTGKNNVAYEKIDGVNAVCRKQSSTAISAGNQTLRRHFNVDLSKTDIDRLGFVMTFYSSKKITDPSTVYRMFWGNSVSKSGNNLSKPGDYDIKTRLDYGVSSSKQLWKSIEKGWNTWFITFNSIGGSFNVRDFNSFFIIFGNDNALSEGDTVFAISSLKLVEITE